MDENDNLYREVGYTAAFLGFTLATAAPELGGAERDQATKVILHVGQLAVALEQLADENEVDWGVTHDYGKCTKALVRWLLAPPTREGYTEVVKGALRESEIVGEGDVHQEAL